MSAAIAPTVKKVAQSLDENQNGIRAQRRQSPDYMPTERTSTASYKSPSTGKKKQKPVEQESLTGLSAALDYISSPVRYLTSVFSQPIAEPQKSPPKPRLKPRNMAKVESNSQKPVEMVQLSETESAPATTADTPPEAFDSLNSELLEPIIEKKVELVQHVPVKDKKSAANTTDHKKSPDPKRSSSQLMKAASKSRITFSTRNYRDQKRQSPSPIRVPAVSPRILSASSIKFASYNNRSYRVTSTEKEESAAKAKKSGKKVFKIDKDRSPINSAKSQSSSATTERRDDVAHNYLPLNAIEISRL